MSHTQNNYICPRINNYPSFEKLLEAKNLYGDHDFLIDEKFSFDDLFSINKAFIVAEPGYGKTRLLKEIIIRADENKEQGVFIDLKKIQGDLRSFIVERSINADDINELPSKNGLQNSTFLKTKNFLLKNTDRIIVCLDALDEVKQEEFTKVVDWIKELSKKYKKIHLFVSCRFHHFEKYKELFFDDNFNYIQIARFSEYQTTEYLQDAGFTISDINKIVDLIKFTERDLLIQIPRYLEMVIDIIRDKGSEYIKQLTKTEIFEQFIYRKLDIEEKKINKQKKEIIKRVLEKLALIMEIYQTSLITKEELITFFDDVKSNLNISFLQQVPIEIFYDRSLLKDNIDTIEFENTEFQEYLAAKEILRLGKVDQIVFDIAVDQELKDIFPSWFNTLGFVVDFDISLLKPLLLFGASNNTIVQDVEYHRFLTRVDTNRLSIEDRKDIFQNVFSYYQQVQHWIGFDIARNLSHYFDVSQNSLLKKSMNGTKATFITKGNVASVLEFILEKNVLDRPEREYWKSKLIELSKDINGVAQRHAISAIGKFKDIALLKKVYKFMNTKDELVIRTFLSACQEVDPNDKFSIQCFVNWTKMESEHITARYGLWEIKEKHSVNYLLDHFIKDTRFLTVFINKEGLFKNKGRYSDNQIIQNIKGVWDSKIQIKCENIIIAAFSMEQWYLAEVSQFIKNLVMLLKERNKKCIFKLLTRIKKSQRLKKNMIGFLHIFSLLLEKEHVDVFIQELKKLGEEKIALYVLQSRRDDGKEIYEEGRKYFKEEYKETEQLLKKNSVEKNMEMELYEKFRFKLEPRKGMYNEGVFNFYLSHKDQLKPFVKEKDRNSLKKIVVESIFEKFDPGEQKFTITKNEDGSISHTYTTHRFIHIFGDSLKIAEALKINVSKYRQCIINYIPYAYSVYLEAIFSLVPDPTKIEIDNLLKIYQDERRTDLQRFMPDSFINASEKYKIINAIPVLEKFVDRPDFFIFYRKSALQTIANIQPDDKYFRSIFERYKRKDDETYQIAEDANKYLIEKFSDEIAINWRFRQLETRCFAFVEQRSTDSVGTNESELRNKMFASPIMHLKHPKYERQFFSLLDKSFDILKREDDYWPYTKYLWEIAVAYFHNLKGMKSYTHLRDLENYIQQHSSQEGINWFKYNLHKLRREYIKDIGKPQSITECIKKYNKLKEIQYLKIATPTDLIETVRSVINEDLKKWIESEGAYKFIQEATRKQEELIQQTIKTQFQNSLLKRGLRENELNIRREEHLLDNQRTDFLISYGFIGPVLIEIKRVDNPQVFNRLERLKYKKKLLKYIKGTNSEFGIFLILQINNKYSLNEYIPKVKDVYKDCRNVEVVGMNCVSNFNSYEETKPNMY